MGDFLHKLGGMVAGVFVSIHAAIFPAALPKVNLPTPVPTIVMTVNNPSMVVSALNEHRVGMGLSGFTEREDLCSLAQDTLDGLVTNWSNDSFTGKTKSFYSKNSQYKNLSLLASRDNTNPDSVLSLPKTG